MGSVSRIVKSTESRSRERDELYASLDALADRVVEALAIVVERPGYSLYGALKEVVSPNRLCGFYGEDALDVVGAWPVCLCPFYGEDALDVVGAWLESRYGAEAADALLGGGQ